MKALILTLVLLMGCQKRVDVKPPQVDGPGWSYVEIEPGRFYVAARSDQLFQDALKELGCPCIIEPPIRVWVVLK